MPTPMGGGRINIRPCTEVEESRNWQIVNNLYNEFNTFVEDPGEFNDTFKVKVSDKDSLESYLFTAFTDPDTRVEAEDPLVKFQIVGADDTDQTVQAFLDSSKIPGYDDPGVFALQLVNGTVRWDVIPDGGGGGMDSYTVRVSSDDGVPEYLHDSMFYQSESVDKQDLIVSSAVTAVTDFDEDQDLVLFVDTSEIAGFHDTEFRVLCMDKGESQYLDAETLVNNYYFEYVEDIAIDVFNDLGAEKYRLIRGQAVGNVSSADGTFLVDNVIPLASGNDPVSGNPSTQVRVANPHGCFYADDELVTAAYKEAIVASPATDWVAWQNSPQKLVVKITDTVTGRSGSTPGTGTVQPVDPNNFSTSIGGTISVRNTSLVPITGSSDVPIYAIATKIGSRYFVDTFDIKSIQGFTDGQTNLLGADTAGVVKWDTLIEWLKRLGGWVLGNNQSIGHDENDPPEWQDDTECP